MVSTRVSAQIILLLLSSWFSFSSYAANENLALNNQDEMLSEIKQLLDSYRGNTSVLRKVKLKIDYLLSNNSKYAPAYKELARYYIMAGHTNSLKFRSGSLELAENSLKTALQINPEYADAYVLFGHLYRLMNKPNEAITSLEKAKRIGTNNPWLHLNWADLLLDKGKQSEAAQHYQNVIESNTTNKKAMGAAFEGLIRYYNSIGALDNVEKTYQRQIAYEPDNAWAYGNYANFLLYYSGNYEKAIEYSRKALGIMNYGVGRYILAASLYRKGAHYLVNEKNSETAQQYFDEAYSIYPNIKKIIRDANRSSHTRLSVEAFLILNKNITP